MSEAIHWFGFIGYEMGKILRSTRFAVMVLILVGIILLANWLPQPERVDSGDGPSAVQQKLVELEKAIELTNDAQVRKSLELQAAVLRYQQDHPDLENHGLAHAWMGMMLSDLGFLYILVAILISDVVTKEVSSGTLRLLLTRPLTRWKILLLKICAATATAWLILGLLMVLAALFELPKHGLGDWMQPDIAGLRWHDGAPSDYSAAFLLPRWQSFLVGLAFALLSLAVLAVALTLVSVFASKVATALSLGLLIALASGAAPQHLGKAAWVTALLPTHMDPMLQFMGTSPAAAVPWTTSALVQLAYACGAVTIGCVAMKRREYA